MSIGPRIPHPARRPRRRVGSALVGAVLVASTLAGCSDSDAETPTDPADLSGHTYLSNTVIGAPIPGGGPLVLSFDKNRMSANAGCNGHGGEVTFDGDTMTPGPLAGTMMACAPPHDETDRWVADLFGAPLTWHLDGTELTLSRGDQRVLLTEQQNRPITETRWQVTALVKNAGVTSSTVLEQRKPFFRIGTDGKLTGNTGCNSMTGTATVTGDVVDFSGIATTRMACEPEVAEVEQTVLAALNGPATVTVDGDEMSLTNRADGSVGLRLTAVGD
ncbi:META domain-containing protein [Gordonia sp. (in: high G+C Gram-positive bacteria)]|uniref:META domain-containing protein n=1 Tax=Gordonia sp. (in: high G+C Gram-positive bacteria) TaxID=84139 RepID=UPI0025B7D6C4|nr:META domain-containing protein [Gordonia sp. (in: high G+C Gram-positive bacteria)]